jgi:hypothetical protein
MKPNKILVPLDGSEMAEAAIAPALEMAQAGSSLILMRAADAQILPGGDMIGAQIQAVREAEAYLAGMKEKLEKTGVKQIETHVWYGPAAPAVVEAARIQKVERVERRPLQASSPASCHRSVPFETVSRYRYGPGDSPSRPARARGTSRGTAACARSASRPGAPARST